MLVNFISSVCIYPVCVYIQCVYIWMCEFEFVSWVICVSLVYRVLHLEECASLAAA